MSSGLLRSSMDHSVPEVWRPGGRGLQTVYNTPRYLFLFLTHLRRSLSLSLSFCLHTNPTCITIILAFTHLKMPFFYFAVMFCTFPFLHFLHSVDTSSTFLYVNLVVKVLHVSFFLVFVCEIKNSTKCFLSTLSWVQSFLLIVEMNHWQVTFTFVKHAVKMKQPAVGALSCRFQLRSQSLHSPSDVRMQIFWAELTPHVNMLSNLPLDSSSLLGELN